MESFKTTFERKDEVEFIIDDDPDLSWLSGFDSDKYGRFFIIVDKGVEKIWGEKIKDQLKKHGKENFSLSVDSVEASKSLAYYPEVVKFLEKNRAGLSDLVIAVGGGVVLDLTGFVCSTYMRGLPFVAVPTTIIGQIDAITAGKTCLNTEETKNLLGTFYYPEVVYNNTKILETAPKYYARQGLAETFKYGLLGSEKLLTLLESYIKRPEVLSEMLTEAMRVRVAIRKKHSLASNLGHTFGHAMEKLSSYEILHGDAISAGTVVSLYLSKKAGLVDQVFIDSVVSRMKDVGLNIYIDKNIDVDRLVSLMMRDKKSTGTHMRLVLLEGIEKPFTNGDSHFYEIEPSEMKVFLENFMSSYEYAVDNVLGFIQKDEITY